MKNADLVQRLRSVVAHDSAQHPKGEECDSYEDADRQQNRGDHPTDTTGVCQRPAAGVHSAGIDLFEIAIPHDPGCNAERRADDQAQNPKDQNECAPMWFHI